MKFLSMILFLTSFSAFSLTTIGTGVSNKPGDIFYNKEVASQKAEESAVTLLKRRCANASGTLLNTYFIGGTVCSVTPGTKDQGRTCQAIAKGDCYDYDAARVSADGASGVDKKVKKVSDLTFAERNEACRESFNRAFQSARANCVTERDGVSAVLDVDKDQQILRCINNRCEKTGPGLSPVRCTTTAVISCGAEIN